MDEGTFRSRLVEKLKGFGQAFPVENGGTHPGTPDLFFCREGVCAWVELKYVPVWPVYDKDVFHVPKYRPAQRNWIRKHYRNGGRAFLFVRVGDDYCLFHPVEAINSVNIDLSSKDFKKKALRHWKGSINYKDLVKVLTYHGNNGKKRSTSNQSRKAGSAKAAH